MEFIKDRCCSLLVTSVGLTAVGCGFAGDSLTMASDEFEERDESELSDETDDADDRVSRIVSIFTATGDVEVEVSEVTAVV